MTNSGHFFSSMLRYSGFELEAISVFCTITFFGCNQTQYPSHHLFRATAKPIVASPLVLDFNGDGKLEIAIGTTDGNFYLLDDSLRDLSGWPQFSKSGFFSSPAAGDIDGDGFPEIFSANETGTLFGWRRDPHAHTPLAVSGFPIELGGLVWSSPIIIADSLIAIGGFEKMFMFDRHGKPAIGWPQQINGWAKATAARRGDVIAISTLTPGTRSRGYLYAWHLDGTPYPNFPITLKMDSHSSPALADLNGDARVEIVLGDDAGFLHVFTLDGSELPGFPRLAGDKIEASPTVAKFDGDNIPDIIAGSADGYLHAWNGLADRLLGWPVAAGDEILASVAVAEIYGDEKPVAIVGTTDHCLYGFYADGSLAPGFPIDCGDKIFSSPWVGDLDGDGQTDIIVGANNGVHRLCNIGKLGAAPVVKFR